MTVSRVRRSLSRWRSVIDMVPPVVLMWRGGRQANPSSWVSRATDGGGQGCRVAAVVKGGAERHGPGVRRSRGGEHQRSASTVDRPFEGAAVVERPRKTRHTHRHVISVT